MENEAEMYHAAATVSTLLLKLGEVSRKFLNSSESNTDVLVDIDEKPRKSKLGADGVDEAKNWSINFDQLIASLLTDNLLVTYFDAKYDLNNILTEYKSQHA